MSTTPTPSTPQRAFPTPAAAAYLGLSTHTLSDWRRLGVGPAYRRMGSDRGRAVYMREDLDAWLDSLEQVETAGGVA